MVHAMRVFQMRELHEAIVHAEAGGQSIHLHNVIVNEKKAPLCFRQAVQRGENIAHLFDMDHDRLVETARDLGINVVLVERKGTSSQHIDLCGRPLRLAMEMAEEFLCAKNPDSEKTV